MSTWRIQSWSRESGRGSLTSAHYDEVPFDANIADVDDFTIGETVTVEVEPGVAPLRVTRVTPESPRFRSPGSPAAPPPLAPDRAERARGALVQADGLGDYRVIRLDSQALEVEFDDDLFAWGAHGTLVVENTRYVEGALLGTCDEVRLAREAERAYLATRCDFDDDPIAITLVDRDATHPFRFIVGTSLRFARMNRRGGAN